VSADLVAARLRRSVAALVPVALALLFTAISLHHSQVAGRDVVVFTGYVVLGLALPGFVLWRLLVSHGTWSLVADLACGASLAYATELATYMVCAHFDHPGVAFLWPVVPVGVSLLPRWRTQVWRRPEAITPLWVPWSLSSLVVYAVALLTRQVWDPSPLSGRAVRAPYIDIPYHLSLIGALSRHVPVDIPAVTGEPLYYHWFVHADLAAARHATGIEPLVLLTRLGPLAMMVVVIVGVAALSHRLTGSWIAGITASVLLCCAGGAALSQDFGELFLSSRIFVSPTTIFAMALLIATAAATFELLRPGPSTRWTYGLWLVLALMLAAVSGAKGSLLPIVLAGYLCAVLMALLFQRRLDRAALGMLGIGVVWFLLAQKFIYGGSSQGTATQPFAIGERVAVNLHLAASGHVSLRLAIAVSALYLGCRVTFWSGAAGLFTRDVWKDPRAHFVVGTSLAGIGAVVALGSASLNEVYFLLVAPPVLAISSAWGFSVLAKRLPRAVAVRVLSVSVPVGIGVGFVFRDLYGLQHPLTMSLARAFLPAVAAISLCVLAGLVIALTSGHHRRLATMLALTSAVAALGLPQAIADGTNIVTSPHAQFRQTGQDKLVPYIGVGGIGAARWLRDHSAVSDLVATNVHCLHPHAAACDHRTTWIAAFTERQMLLEGWAYTFRSAGEAAKQNVPVALVAFWRPSELENNDLAFEVPTAARIAVLRQRYGVAWMFADTRYPVDLTALRAVADLKYHVGVYDVFKLR
jgi:hypothetical protein